MKGTARILSGYTALILSGLYGTAALIAVCFVHNAIELLFSPEVVAPYWAAVLSLLILYVVETGEHTLHVESKLLHGELKGVEVFDHAARFLPRLAEISVGAEIIATLNFSPPAGRSAQLDTYFNALHTYIYRSGTPLTSFRSIASVEDSQKAEWMVERAHMFRRNPRVSLACFAEATGIRLMCFHVTMKDGVGYCAFYPPVPLTGVMHAAVICNTELARMLLEQFDLAWSQSVKTLEGGNPSAAGLEFLHANGASARTQEFIELSHAAGGGHSH